MKMKKEKKRGISGSMQLGKLSLVPVLLVLVGVRIYMLFFVAEDLTMINYVRHGVNTLAWFAIAYFMFHCSMRMHPLLFPKKTIIKMKNIAFWTMIICVLRIIVSVFYYWPIVSPLIWPTLHNILEIVVWAMLAIFFGCYWLIRVKQEKEGLLDMKRSSGE